jgi:ketosteroid isomerase-like protein
MARWWFLIVALVVSIAACQEQGEQAGTTEEEATTAADPAAVEDYIRTSADGFGQAMIAGDTETITSFYADDAVLMPAGMPRVDGADAIRSTYQEMHTTGLPTAFSLNPRTIVVAEGGDMAYEEGTYSFTGPGPDGTTMTDGGKYLSVWKPTAGGEWKIAVTIWNSDQMPGGPPEAPTGQ